MDLALTCKALKQRRDGQMDRRELYDVYISIYISY